MDLTEFTSGLMEDLNSLRSGGITASDGRARAALAREVLRSVYLNVEVFKNVPSKSIEAQTCAVHDESKQRTEHG